MRRQRRGRHGDRANSYHHVAANIWNHRRQPHDDDSLGIAEMEVRGRGERELRDPDGISWRFS